MNATKQNKSTIKPGMFVRHYASNMIGIVRKLTKSKYKGAPNAKVFWLNGFGHLGGSESRVPVTGLVNMEGTVHP